MVHRDNLEQCLSLNKCEPLLLGMEPGPRGKARARYRSQS